MRQIAWWVAAIAALLVTPAFAVTSTNSLLRLSCEAGEIAKSNGTGWECANDEVGGGGGPSFVLNDSSGQQIGTVISVSLDEGILKVSTLLEFATPAGNKTVVLHALNGPFRRVLSDVASFRQNSIPFLGADCSGEPFLFASTGFPNAIWSKGVVIGTDVLTKLYVATSQVIELLTMNSILFNGSCLDTIFTNFPFVPAELIEGDLDMIFPPPFSLELQ